MEVKSSQVEVLRRKEVGLVAEVESWWSLLAEHTSWCSISSRSQSIVCKPQDQTSLPQFHTVHHQHCLVSHVCWSQDYLMLMKISLVPDPPPHLALFKAWTNN